MSLKVDLLRRFASFFYVFMRIINLFYLMNSLDIVSLVSHFFKCYVV